MNEIATIGHNSGGLSETRMQALSRVLDFEDALARMPDTIEDDETVAKAATFVSQITTAAGDAETIRKDEKQPFLDGGREVDAWWQNTVLGPLDKVKTAVRSRQTAYLTAKAEAERKRLKEQADAAAAAIKDDVTLATAVQAEQATTVKTTEITRVRSAQGATVSLRTSWDFRNLDRAKIDLEALRPYLSMDGLEKAVRAAIKAKIHQIPGVEIYEKQEAR